ncbi:MAG TPA: hypothetical protein VKW08_01960 [Xanthobacteraceae bacterium]|jgi:hypothetical protein|nr:hypothetical protein [Xanthobacteraceae bacterium]
MGNDGLTPGWIGVYIPGDSGPALGRKDAADAGMNANTTTALAIVAAASARRPVISGRAKTRE